MFEAIIFVVASLTIGGLIGAGTVRWYGRRKRERPGMLDVLPGSPMQERLDRLEHAVDAIAIELERVGEGQRFVTKLLSERGTRDRTPPSPQPGAVRAVRPTG